MHSNPEVSTILITSFITFVTSAWIMQKSIGVFSLRRLTIPGFWYLTYLAMIFIPSHFIFFEQTHAARYSYIFAVVSILVAVPFGVIFVNMLLRFKRSEIENYYTAPIIQEKRMRMRSIIRYMVILSVAIGIVILYIFEVKTIPLFVMFQCKGDVISLDLLREESLKLLVSPFRYLYHLFRDFVYPLMIIIALGYYLYSQKRAWLYLFLGTFIVGILYAAFSLAKFPPSSIILLTFIFLYLFYSGKVSKRIIMIGLVMFLAFPTTMILVGQPEKTIPSVVITIVERIFLAPANVLYYYYEVVPEQVNFLYGQTMGKLTWLIGLDYFDISNYVAQYINPAQPIKSGSANAAFIGDLYANFSMLGVLLGGVLIGAFMQLIQIHLLIRQKKTVLNVAAYAFLMYEFMLLNILPLTSVIIFSGMPILLILMILYIPRKRKMI